MGHICIHMLHMLILATHPNHVARGIRFGVVNHNNQV